MMRTGIKKISEEFSKGNFDLAYHFMADDIEWNIVGDVFIKGKEAVMAFCNKMMIDMAKSTLHNTNCIVADDLIAVEGYCDYVKENNEPGKLEYCDVYRFKDEQLLEIKSYCIDIKNK